MRRPRARRTHARPHHRPRGRAHPRVQHGVPEVLSRGDRWLRSAVPHRRGRRGRLLASAGAGVDPRLSSGRDGLAPPPQLGAHLLAAADRLRPRRGDARAQVAREVQRAGPRALGGPYLRQRADARPRMAPSARVPRRVGRRAVSVAVRARAQPARLAPADAGVAPDDGDPGGNRRLERGLEAVPARATTAVVCRRSAHRAGLAERGSRPLRGRAGALVGPAAASAPDRRAALDAAPRPPARAAQRRPNAVATARHATAGAALAGHRVHLERAVAGAGATAPRHGSGPASGRRERAARRATRTLGSRGPGRVLRRRPLADGRRSACRREAAHSPAVVAGRARAGPAPDALLRWARARCGARPRLGRRRSPRTRRPAVRLAHPGAMRRCDDHDPRGRRAAAARRRRMSDLALYRRLHRQARPYWLHLAGLFGIGLLASPIALLNPVPLKLVVDSVLGDRPLPRFLQAILPATVGRTAPAMLAVAVGLLLAVTALGQLHSLTTALLRTYVGERLMLDLRSQLVQQVQRLSLSYHDSRGTADSIYRIQHDAPAIQNILVEGAIPFVSAAIPVATMCVVTAHLDRQLALVALTICPPLFFLSRVYRPRMRRQSRRVKKLESTALAVVQEALGALRVVKAFGQEAHETARFVHRSREGMTERLRMALLEGGYVRLIGLVPALGVAAVLLIGVGHVRAGVITLGQLLPSGVALRAPQADAPRRQCGAVLQDTVRLSARIAGNTASAAPAARREQIGAAARGANAHECIVRPRRGYDTQVGERGAEL